MFLVQKNKSVGRLVGGWPPAAADSDKNVLEVRGGVCSQGFLKQFYILKKINFFNKKIKFTLGKKIPFFLAIFLVAKRKKIRIFVI
jgi:hypothetical protein